MKFLLPDPADFQIIGSQDNVVQNSFIVEEIEELKDHPHLLAVAVDVSFGVRQANPLEGHCTLSGRFHSVQAAEEGGFARA